MEHISIQTALPEFIENVKSVIHNDKTIAEYNRSVFTFACLFNDILLKDYDYMPSNINNTTIIKHIWINKKDQTKITNTDIRLFLRKDIYHYIGNTLQNEYLVEAQLYEPIEPKHVQTQQNITACCIWRLNIIKGKIYFKLLEYLPQL